MATASAAAPASAPAHAPADRPNMVSIGTIVWLSSELMFFAALFAMYFTIRAVHDVWPPEDVKLNMLLAVPNTTILVLSSVTCQLGVFAAERFQVARRGSLLQVRLWGMREWFILTFLMGAVFIAGQVTEYAALAGEGVTVSSSSYGSVFYLTTGFHGLHVTGGLVAFLLVLGRTFARRRFDASQATSAIVTSYYWHFVDVVWIGLFFTIYVIQ